MKDEDIINAKGREIFKQCNRCNEKGATPSVVLHNCEKKHWYFLCSFCEYEVEMTSRKFYKEHWGLMRHRIVGAAKCEEGCHLPIYTSNKLDTRKKILTVTCFHVGDKYFLDFENWFCYDCNVWEEIVEYEEEEYVWEEYEEPLVIHGAQEEGEVKYCNCGARNLFESDKCIKCKKRI